MAIRPRLLLLTTPELRGPDVEHVQRRLRELGIPPGAIDAIYGPATAHAVRVFQRRAGLAVDGIVGPKTAHALTETLKPAPAVHAGRPAPGIAALAWLADRVGMKENPPNSNRSPISLEFGLPGQPWCAMGVSLAFKHGANLILGEGPGPAPWAFWAGRGFAYCPALEAWLKTRGYWKGKTTPARGMVSLYNWGTPAPGHCGIVERYLGGGKFLAIEANTAVGNDSDGGEVMRRERYVSQLVGLGEVTWTNP